MVSAEDGAQNHQEIIELPLPLRPRGTLPLRSQRVTIQRRQEGVPRAREVLPQH